MIPISQERIILHDGTSWVWSVIWRYDDDVIGTSGTSKFQIIARFKSWRAQRRGGW